MNSQHLSSAQSILLGDIQKECDELTAIFITIIKNTKMKQEL
jgi:hypothetical protein